MTEPIKLEYQGESAGAVQAAQEVNRSLDTVEKKAGGIGSAFSNLGGIISGAFAVAGGAILTKGLEAATGFLNDALGEARENAEGQAALQQALAATGAQTGVTAQQVNALAGEMQLLTKYTDDEILAAGTVLARFKEIGSDIFDEANKAALDLAQTLGVDTVTAAKLVGKALAEPGEGLARLKAAGVVFTDAQEKVIKSMFDAGDAAGAQALILEHLNATIGGTAEALGKTPQGQGEIFKHMVDDIKQSVGDVLLPLITGTMGKVIEIFRNPAVQDGIQSFVSTVTGGIETVTGVLGGLANSPIVQQGFTAFTTRLTTITTAAQDFFNFIGNSDTQSFTKLKDTLTSAFGPEIGGMIASLADHVGSFIYALNEGWTPIEAFRMLLDDVFGEGTGAKVGAFVQNLLAALQTFAGFLDQNVIPVLTTFATWLGGTILTSIQGLATWIMVNLLPALTEMGTQIGEAVLPVLLRFGGWLTETAIPALQKFAEVIGPPLKEALTILGTLITEILLPALTKIVVWIFKDGVPALEKLGGIFNDVLNAAVKTFADLWLKITSAFEKVTRFIDETHTALKNVGDYIGSTLNDILAPFLATVQSIRDAFAGWWDFIKKVIDALAQLGSKLPQVDIAGAAGAAGGAINDALGGLGGLLGGGGAQQPPAGPPNPFGPGVFGGGTFGEMTRSGASGGASRPFNNYGSITVQSSADNVDALIDDIETRLGQNVERRVRNRE